MVVENLVYYISNIDDDPYLRLYVPKHLRGLVVKQYHDMNGHMGVQKTFDSIRQKYYWPNLFKELNDFVTACVVCQTRSLQKIRQPLQETEVTRMKQTKQNRSKKNVKASEKDFLDVMKLLLERR